MLCFEVTINDGQPVRAGHSEISCLTAITTYVSGRGREKLDFSLGGLISRSTTGDEHFDWVNHLAPGQGGNSATFDPYVTIPSHGIEARHHPRPTPGTTLGPYQVTAKIGEGGMGRVDRDTDTKLNRQVALKILLPEAFAADPRLAAD